MNNKNKKMDITDPKTYAHFKDCHLCGWSFDPEFFDGHNCKQMIDDTKEADRREKLGLPPKNLPK